MNFQGLRFHNELLTGGASGTPAVLKQNPPTAWAIIDSSMLDRLEAVDPVRREGRTKHEMAVDLFEKSTHIKRGFSVKSLADSMGIDGETLGTTINTYNDYLDKRLLEDPEFGKSLVGLRKIEKAPLYAVQFFPMARKNFGGVKTDLGCRVSDIAGRIIPGLYAAREVAGMAGGHINGNAGLEGTILGPSIFSGRIAGRTAASDIKLLR